MENASKALIIAGEILIALLVISALLLMFNQIGSYEKAKKSNVKESQLAQFNLDFERYTDDNGIIGTDIISIINKVVDYNKKDGVTNSINYNIKMSVEISGLNNFNSKYSVESGITKLFNTDKLIMGENNNNKYFAEIITQYTQYENKYTLSVMSILASNYKEIKTKMNETGIINEDSQQYKELIKELTGKNFSNPPTLNQIGQYKQYSEFKGAKFVSSKVPDYNNGQIQNLYFKFVE